MSPIRSIEPLTASGHARDRMKERNIGLYEVKQAIESGSTSPAKGRNNTKYRLDMPGVDLLVVVDQKAEKIVSVYYDDEQGAEGGAL